MGKENNEIKQTVQLQLQSASAKRLQEKLSLIKNRVELSKKRWFWELLQNASDYNDKVSVRLVVNNDKVEFYHDGAPFSITDALNLISPNSDKDNDDSNQTEQRKKGNIGKFGTGLVSTHILSSIMKVHGLFVNEEKRLFEFSFDLDRSCFEDKLTLINQMSEATEKFSNTQFDEVADASYCQTSFSYILNHPLPKLPAMASSDIDLDYLYSVLPYTLCFMDRVVSVTIEDNRNGNHSYKIERKSQTENQLSFSVMKDGCLEELDFAVFCYNDTSTAFQYQENHIMPYPEGMSRMFCGLPLVGMENISMPFILNSLEFEPEQERDGIAFDPTANPENLKILKDSIHLYEIVLDYVEKNKLRNAYHLTKMAKRYNGSQTSRTKFCEVGIEGYKQQLMKRAVVKNSDGDFIPFSQLRIPFRDSQADVKLYGQAHFVASSVLPVEEDYQAWFDATDFVLFKDQEYTYQMLADKIQSTASLYSFGKEVDEVNNWLKESLAYLKGCNKYIFAEKSLIPNQLGELKKNSELYVDNALPNELKTIYNQLYEYKDEKIETELMDKTYDSVDVVNQAYDVEKISRKIDDAIADIYIANKGDISKIAHSLNELYKWMSASELAKEKLQSWYKWYYPRRATLMVDMLSDTQREQALIIAQSGKLEALASLASADLTKDELALLVANIKKLPVALSLLGDSVDDSSFANLAEGDYGEEIVYKKLRGLYPKSEGYSVIWASRDTNEPCYDFVVKQNDNVVCYCDAKTTKRGITNADSIPFFMRRSQWEFLQTLSPDTPYYIARVFMGSDDIVKFIRISEHVKN